MAHVLGNTTPMPPQPGKPCTGSTGPAEDPPSCNPSSRNSLSGGTGGAGLSVSSPCARLETSSHHVQPLLLVHGTSAKKTILHAWGVFLNSFLPSHRRLLVCVHPPRAFPFSVTIFSTLPVFCHCRLLCPVWSSSTSLTGISSFTRKSRMTRRQHKRRDKMFPVLAFLQV